VWIRFSILRGLNQYLLEPLLLFAAYLIFFAWLVTRVRFFTNSGLTRPQLIMLFLLKVMAGIFYGWTGIYYGEMAQMIDTWAYYVESLQEYSFLKAHPIDFITSLFHTTYHGGYANFLTTHNSWWNDVKANFLIKIMAVFNLFSFGHYYINVIFYSFLSFFGPVALYRIMKDIFTGRKLLIIAATFLIPSFLYWTSGLHKEGLIVVGLSLMMYHIYFGFREGKFPFYRVALIVFGFCLVVILRNFLVLTLIPPLVAWIICRKAPKLSPFLVFAGVSFVFAVFFFLGGKISPKLDFVSATVIKQQEFLKLGGGSAVPVTLLQPSLKSFVRNTPQALSLTILRPYPTDVRHLLSLAAAIEISVLLLLFLLFLFFRRKDLRMVPFLWFCLFFSIGVLLMVGYTVNILGAIVRYRSIVLPLLVVPMLAWTDWERIGKKLNINFR